MEAVSALEVARARAAVIRCLAEPSSLDAISAPPGATAVRVAPDELLLVGDPEDTATLLAAVETGSDAFVIDQSDGWAAITLAGAQADEAFRRLSHLPLPGARPAALQGAVAGLAAMVVAHADRIVVLVSSTAADYLDDRIGSAGAEGERS